MRRIAVIALLGCLALSLAWGTDVFRWVDEQGGVHYSDQPPPLSAKKVQKLSGRGNVVEVDKESFDTKMAKAQNPVVLYASDCGQFCDDAKAYLRQRGVPFTLKDPSKEPEYAVELKKLVGAMEVPVIVAGQSHQKGFEATSWDTLLDAAGYPRTPLIPSSSP